MMFTEKMGILQINSLNHNGIERLETDILKFLAERIRNIIKKIDVQQLRSLEEIRFRANKPLMLQNSRGDWIVGNDGKLTVGNFNSFTVLQDDIIKTVELMSENSIYAYQDEIKNGFITLKGGHRVGLTGRAVLDGGRVKNIKDISGLNIRISREVLGCCNKVLEHIVSKRNEVYNTLIISPPQCGKTTLLRDIARTLSDGVTSLNFKGLKVGIIDERSEIAACYKGVAQNSVGVRTDVLDGCPKAMGMDLLLRSMSPQVIITDEIGNEGDRDAVMRVINAGVKIITTAHGYNVSEMKTRREVISLINEKVFDRFVVLSNTNGPGTIEEVIDGSTMEVII